MDAETTFSRWLYKEMNAHGYPVGGPKSGGISRLAEDAGVPQASVSRIVNGRAEPSIDNLRKIGTVLGYSLAQMMVNAGLADADEMSQPIPPGVIDDTHWWLGRQLVARRIALDPAYAPRAAFADAVAELGLDETTIAQVENGKLAVDDRLAARLDGAYQLAAGSVAGFLKQGTALVPIDVRHVSGSAYMVAASGAQVTSTTGEVVVLDLRTAPEDASEDVKAYWNGLPVDHRIIWNLPIPQWERQYLVDHLTAMREAIKRARAEQRGNGDTQAS